MSRPIALGTLIDSNVIIDIVGGDPTWSDWSASAIEQADQNGPLIINPVVFAEVSTRFVRIEEVDAILPRADFVRAAIPWDAAFLAGQSFLRYRRRGGVKTSPLPDFFIGAHAAVVGLRLLTRDARRYRTYFPTIELIAP